MDSTELLEPRAGFQLAWLPAQDLPEHPRGLLLVRPFEVELTECEVDLAEQGLEVDKTRELIRSLAAQQKLALRACYLGLGRHTGRISTGNAYDAYLDLCRRDRARPLSQRRFSDMVSFLDIYGLVNAPVTSKGRYGKTRELSVSLPKEVIGELLKGD